MPQNRQQAERRGRRAEGWAALWLTFKGYSILARNVALRTGEIDLIARKRGVLVFVEVKQRSTLEHGKQAVTAGNWLRISHAAAQWASQRRVYAHFDWRYDLIVVTPWHRPHHFQDFWRPDE